MESQSQIGFAHTCNGYRERYNLSTRLLRTINPITAKHHVRIKALTYMRACLTNSFLIESQVGEFLTEDEGLFADGVKVVLLMPSSVTLDEVSECPNAEASTFSSSTSLIALGSGDCDDADWLRELSCCGCLSLGILEEVDVVAALGKKYSFCIQDP